MKKSRLHQIIREEIHNVMNESIVPALYKSVPDNYAYDKFAIDIATFFKEEYGNHLVSRFMSVLGKSLKKSVNEEIQVTEPIWKKMSDEERIEALYSVVPDPDEAQKYFELDWRELPPGFERDMTSPPL